MAEYIAVSVVIPMYNMGNYIISCLESILSQSIKNIEIIVIDDKSTDASVEKVEYFAYNDARVKLIPLKKNSGPGIARNIGIKYASGKYCMFMDADDMYVDKNSIEYIYNIAEENKVNIACCDKIDLDSKSNTYIPKSSIRSGEYLCRSTDISSIFWYTTYIYNREFIIKKRIYFPKIRIFEDPVFLAKILKEADKIFCSDRPIYVYRVMHKETELTLDKVKTILSAQEEIRNILSDDYNIWNQQYISLLNVILDGKLYKKSPDTITCLHQVKKIIRSFPGRSRLKRSTGYLLFLVILLTLCRRVNALLPMTYKKILKNITRRLHILK